MYIKLNKIFLVSIFFLSLNSTLYAKCCLCSTTSMSIATSSVQNLVQSNMSSIRSSVDLIVQKYKNQIAKENEKRHQLINDNLTLDVEIELLTKELNKYSKKVEEHLYKDSK